MAKIIFLCASMAFYKQLVEVEEKLKQMGYVVHIPVSAQVMKQKNDFVVSHFKNAFSSRQKGELIHQNFHKIASSDSILVINDEKNGLKGYIGANVLMEIGLAFYLKKKIYIWNAIEDTAPYKEELSTFGVNFINKNLGKIN